MVFFLTDPAYLGGIPMEGMVMQRFFLFFLVCLFVALMTNACSCIEIIGPNAERSESAQDASGTEKSQESQPTEFIVESPAEALPEQPTENPIEAPPQDPPPPACEGLAWKECHDAAPRCLVYLERRNSPYRCRTPKNDCERKTEASACSADASCLWIADFCYCPPDAVCGCGDGPPAVCLQKDTLCSNDEDCGRFCLLHFGCCSPRSSCDDLHPGCESLSRELPSVCRNGFVPSP